MEFTRVENLFNQELASPCKMQQSISSLNSPVDSGVQLLDSESDQISVMSSSGCDLDMEIKPATNDTTDDSDPMIDDLTYNIQEKLLTKSDILNQNVNVVEAAANPSPVHQLQQLGTPTHNLIDASKDDIMNISLNSYELLDYTMANSKLRASDLEDQMHVSLSEEVNETLKLQLQQLESTVESSVVPTEPAVPENVVEDKPVDTIVDEQIVFRRQRKKKSRSDTPKKRVSFHEDILNSTKIDDIHINQGFITFEPEGSTNFLLRGFRKKHDIVQGRYSWAAEGDSTYHDNAPMCNREVQSDIYIQQRLSSVSSSSSGSMSSSIDEEPSKLESDALEKSDEIKKPKSSCLKKTKHRKVIDTNVVEEVSSLKSRKKSETNLLDANIFGSLKNILTFSTSLPITERGVPEGQEDIIYSTSEVSCGIDTSSLNASAKKQNVQLDTARNNLKLTIQPMYQNNLPENIILCDSNVYEHKGISYSYEYDNFTKNFEHNCQKPKSSSIYQKILKEFNFFRKKATEDMPQQEREEFSVVNDEKSAGSSLTVVECKQSSVEEMKEQENDAITINKYACSVNMDWSDNESMSNDSTSNARHLNSPRRKVNRANHYTVQNALKPVEHSKNLRPTGGGGSSSKSSLINRFLRHVTTSKMLDMKLQKKLSRSKRYMPLHVPRRHLERTVNENKKLDAMIEDEILKEKRPVMKNSSLLAYWRTTLLNTLNVIDIFPISSVYTTSGTQKPLLLVVSDAALHIFSRGKNNGKPALITLPYAQLNTIIIGPSAQTIHISSNTNDKQCMVITESCAMTNDIMIQLEMAIRANKMKIALPAIKQLTMLDMRNLRKFISKQTPVEKDDEYFYYTILNAQEYQADNFDAYFGPNKEGPLMYRFSELESRWETAYFILKAGILYMLSSPSNPEPMKVYPLLNGACHGAKRVHSDARPHTFQLNLSGNVLYLAAPDEYVASEWLQALIHAATGMYHHRNRSTAPLTSLLMTSEQILLVREAFSCSILNNETDHNPIKGAQVVSYAAISNLISFKLPSAEKSWCILEFACREVRENSGDWILYFPTNQELEYFISTLEMLWIYNNEGESFPLTTLSETDDVNKKCTIVNDALQKIWL